MDEDNEEEPQEQTHRPEEVFLEGACISAMLAHQEASIGEGHFNSGTTKRSHKANPSSFIRRGVKNFRNLTYCVACKQGNPLLEELDDKIGEKAVFSTLRDRIREEWERADLNKDGHLNMDEVQQMLRNLNAHIPSEEIRTWMERYDQDGNGVLDFEEFQKMFESIHSVPDLRTEFITARFIGEPRPKLDPKKINVESLYLRPRHLVAFFKWASCGQDVRTERECTDLIIHYGAANTSSQNLEQMVGEQTDEEAKAKMIHLGSRLFRGMVRGRMGSTSSADSHDNNQRYSTTENNALESPMSVNHASPTRLSNFSATRRFSSLSTSSQEPRMSYVSFVQMMTDGNRNGAGDPEKLEKVYMDMTQPLSHYFISSSHNSYLLGNQLNSVSSAYAVIRALKLGVRVIELDAWDGSDGQPIVTHGHTLCKPTSFRSCIMALRDYGFEATDYPCIITIENHCSMEQQLIEIAIMEELLGDRLFRWEGAESLDDFKKGPACWLSPEDLRGKFVVRDRPLKKMTSKERQEVKNVRERQKRDGNTGDPFGTSSNRALTFSRRNPLPPQKTMPLLNNFRPNFGGNKPKKGSIPDEKEEDGGGDMASYRSAGSDRISSANLSQESLLQSSSKTEPKDSKLLRSIIPKPRSFESGSASSATKATVENVNEQGNGDENSRRPVLDTQLSDATILVSSEDEDESDSSPLPDGEMEARLDGEASQHLADLVAYLNETGEFSSEPSKIDETEIKAPECKWEESNDVVVEELIEEPGNKDAKWSDEEIISALKEEENDRNGDDDRFEEIDFREDGVHQELLKLMYIKNIALPLIKDEYFDKDDDSPVQYRDPGWVSSSSIVEQDMRKLTRPGARASAFNTYAKRHLLRIFPSGARIASSNYDPVPAWNCGAQIVALNYQTFGKFVWLNQGKFSLNGGCGFVLKPRAMLEAVSIGLVGDNVEEDRSKDEDDEKGPTRDKRVPLKALKLFGHNSVRYIHENAPAQLPWTLIPDPQKTRVLQVTVVSGHYLPKPVLKRQQNLIVNPYVVVSMRGTEEDTKAWQTKWIPNNGFNPCWRETFQFTVHFDELALLMFVIRSKDQFGGKAKGTFVAQNVLPVQAIRSGYRMVPLLYSNGAVVDNAYLFARFIWICPSKAGWHHRK